MTNDTAPFLICARQETRNVNKVNDWNIESITETDETGRFVRSVNVQATSHYFWLVSNDTNGLTIKTSEASNDICSIEWLYFIVFTIIYSSCNNIFHVVRHVTVIWQQAIQAFIFTSWIVTSIYQWSIFHIVGWQEA